MRDAATCPTAIMKRRQQWLAHLDAGGCSLQLLPDVDWQDVLRVRRYLDGLPGLRSVTCDCRRVDISTTPAIGWLITLYRFCQIQGLEFQVVNPSPASLARYQAHGLDSLLPIAA
ncbi:MAG: hypothetical protein EA402_13855 [Planctomycetota bacterium]|nr:MAG: hypothetical protein EA402_13855 [Planctomycetota bacterium]